MSENNAKILIIDDDETMRDSCTQVLQKSGYEIEIAENGEKGIAKAKEINPDLVLLDLKMPGLSGIEVLKRLKKFDERIIIIIITGYATVESAVDTMKQGVFEYLPKPFTPKELRKIVLHGLMRRKCLMEADRLREEKEKMKKNFVSLVSHELRAPLSAVQQNFMTITSGMMGELPDTVMNTIQRLSGRIEGLIHLINDWLDLSRIESGEVEIECIRVDLKEVLSDIINLFTSTAEKNEVKLKLNAGDENYDIMGNGQTIRMLFTNLIQNAVKYNRKGGAVAVIIEKGEKHVTVLVKDTGIGIPEDKLPLIFEQFYRVKDKKPIEGSGLGLSIVKEIVDVHQGIIEVSSKLNKGTTFMVKLPTNQSCLKVQNVQH